MFLILRIWNQLPLERWIRRLPTVLQIPLLVPFIFVLLSAILIEVSARTLVGLVRGIWFRIHPGRASRDIAGIAGEADLDTVSEAVANEGQALREHGRRLILHDQRLLPRPKPPANVWPRPRRRKVMSREDASRLFSATLRTRDRRIRDLLPDEAQLQRFALPVWKTEQDVADALELTLGELRHFSIHRERDPVCHYVSFTIPRRSGGQRLIMAPKCRLKHIQRRLLRELVALLPVHEQAHGFITGRSISTGAAVHVGRAIVLKLDLRDFFPSVTFARVRGLLIGFGYGYTVATVLAVLMTEAERQPVQLDDRMVYVPVTPRHCVQGAPTSPGLCNSLCLRLDRRLAGVARRYGWNYTRYADDLTFSGDAVQHCHTIRRFAEHICRAEGFQINAEKTRIQRAGQRQTVTGVVVNQTAGLSRTRRRLLRSTIHRLSRKSAVPATATPQQVNGWLAYLRMLNPDQARVLQQRWGQAER